MTRTILNLHRRNTSNIGDLMCAPYLYFPSLLGTTAAEILGFRRAEEESAEQRQRFDRTFATADLIVIGGGGLLEIDFFAPFFDYLKSRRTTQKVVIWGAGHNNWQLRDWRKLKTEYSFDPALFDLIGTRDYNSGQIWVPCASCMSGDFDKPREIRRDIGLYVHAATLRNEKLRRQLPQDFEMIDNSASFEEALDFLGSSDLVLTDSFHGAYWATLLGRRAVSFPTSSKFYDLKHPVPFCAPEDWQRYSRLSRTFPEALQECRDHNMAFAEKVADLL